MGFNWLGVAVVVVLASSVLGVVGEDEAALLKSCWNAKYNSTPVSFEEWTSGYPARMYMVDAWWSPRNSGIPLTVFTMTTLDRLGMLEAQCRGYAGPLSAAVYVPLVLEDDPNLGSDFAASKTTTTTSSRDNKGARGRVGGRRLSGDWRRRQLLLEPSEDPIAAARVKLQDFFTRMEEAGAAGGNSNSTNCQLRLMLLAERLMNRPLGVIMPTNVMRNAAMLGAATQLSAMFDVDLGISANINSRVRNETWIGQVVSETNGEQPGMCVLPAWEIVDQMSPAIEELAVEGILNGDKDRVVAMWLQHGLQAFQFDICRHCHGPLDHKQWASTNQPYIAPYEQGFEPWGILWRLRDPGYDERFRGWLYDKQMHVEALGQKHGFKMVVMPDLWLIHRPHKKVAIAQIEKATREKDVQLLRQFQQVQQVQQQQQQQQQQQKHRDFQALLKVIQLPNGTVTNSYKLYRLYVDTLRAHERNILAAQLPYEPQLNTQFLHCKSVLPWWRQ